MSLFRISLVGWCLVTLSVLPSVVSAQQSFSYPNTAQPAFASTGDGGFGVSSPAFPDTQHPGFADHGSMSPDSWSAPPTGPVMQLQEQAWAVESNPVQLAPNQITPNQIPTQAPARQFSPTPASRFQPGIPTDNGWKNNTPRAAKVPQPNSTATDGPESNLFQGERPKLLKFDSRDALSNAKQATPAIDTEAPNVPELNTESPFRLAKANLSKGAAKQSSAGGSALGFGTSNLRSPIAPLQGVTGQSMPVPNLPNQNVLSLNPGSFQASGYAHALQQQGQNAIQPALAGQVVSRNSLPVEQNTWGHPAQQYGAGPAMGAIPPTHNTMVNPGMQASMVQNPMAPNPMAPNPMTPNPMTPNPMMQYPMAPNSMLPNPMMQSAPNFRSDLGFRSPMPTTRHAGSYDNGQKFDFEDKKKEYPPLSEILATGRYFGSLAARFVRPHAQNNTAFTTSATFVEGVAFDYDYDFSPFVRFGFESKYGPGIEFDYFKLNGKSNQAQFTSNGAVTAQVQTVGPGASQFGAVNAGESLNAQHTLNFETFGVSFFKEVKLPISRVNGRFGFQYASIAHNLDASLSDAAGELGTFNSRSDFRGIGPKFTFEYYRPVGHTPLEFITAISGGVTYGRRDQFVDNTLGTGFSRVGSDEFLTNIEFNTGIQYKHNLAENRSVFARLGTSYSTWLGGGTAIDPQSDFGVRGFSFTVGYNR